MKIEVERAGHGSKLYSKHTELFDDKRLSFIESIAPTPWKVKTNYSSYTIFDAEGKKIATLPDGTKDTTVDGGCLRELFVGAPQFLAEVLRLHEEVKQLREEFGSYIDLWNICIELYDGDIELHRFKDWLDERSGGDLYPIKHKEESE